MLGRAHRIGLVTIAACGGLHASAGQLRATPGATPVAIVKSGDAVPDAPAGTFFTAVNIAGVDQTDGAVAFIGSLTINNESRSGLYLYHNGAVVPLVGYNAIGPAGETVQSVIGSGDYESGAITFAAITSGGQALYRYTAGQRQPLAALARQGDLLDGSSSPIDSFFFRGVGGDASGFAFRAGLADNSRALYGSAGGPAALVVNDQMHIPVPEMGHFIDFPEVHYRDGRLAFIGTGQDPDDPKAGPEPAGVFIATPGGTFDMIAAHFMPVPNPHDDDDRFNEFERPRILPDGSIAFTGGHSDDGDPQQDHHMGVYSRDPNLAWRTYIDSDAQLPGLHADIDEFNGYSVETGVNFFGVNDEDGGSYIYYQIAEGVFGDLVDTYSPLDGKDLLRVRLVSDTAFGGELFFRADFTDGTSGIYTVSVPEPAPLALSAVAICMCIFGRRRPRPSALMLP